MRYKGSQWAMMKLIMSENFLPNLNQLIRPYAKITEYDNWMPKNIHLNKEAELKNFLRYNFEEPNHKDIVSWWLHVDTTTPNWDFISTCDVRGKRGILLVEAKAHYDEVNDESKGKALKSNASEDSKLNHVCIGQAIEEAKDDLVKRGFSDVNISLDSCYQLSNRIAHAWWLARNGVPVVLLYLGFLNTNDMKNGNRVLFSHDSDWQNCFKEHAAQVGANKLLDKKIDCGAGTFNMICRSFNSLNGNQN